MKKTILFFLVYVFKISLVFSQKHEFTATYIGIGGYNNSNKFNQVNNKTNFNLEYGFNFQFKIKDDVSILTGIEANSKNQTILS